MSYHVSSRIVLAAVLYVRANLGLGSLKSLCYDLFVWGWAGAGMRAIAEFKAHLKTIDTLSPK